MAIIKYRQMDDRQVATIEGLLFTGVVDSRGTEIYEGDKLRFADKGEWYKSDLLGLYSLGKPVEERVDWLAAQPFEERVVTLPVDYEWLLSSEIQTYWEVVT